MTDRPISSLINDCLFATSEAVFVDNLFALVEVYDELKTKPVQVDHVTYDNKSHNEFEKLIEDNIGTGSYTQAFIWLEKEDLGLGEPTPERYISILSVLNVLRHALNQSMTKKVGVAFPDPRQSDEMREIQQRVLLLESMEMEVNEKNYQFLFSENEILKIEPALSAHYQPLLDSAKNLRDMFISELKLSRRPKQRALICLTELRRTLDTVVSPEKSSGEKKTAILNYEVLLTRSGYLRSHKFNVVTAFISAALLVVGALVGFVVAGPVGGALGLVAGGLATGVLQAGLWKKNLAAERFNKAAQSTAAAALPDSKPTEDPQKKEQKEEVVATAIKRRRTSCGQ